MPAAERVAEPEGSSSLHAHVARANPERLRQPNAARPCPVHTSRRGLGLCGWGGGEGRHCVRGSPPPLSFPSPVSSSFSSAQPPCSSAHPAASPLPSPLLIDRLCRSAEWLARDASGEHGRARHDGQHRRGPEEARGRLGAGAARGNGQPAGESVDGLLLVDPHALRHTRAALSGLSPPPPDHAGRGARWSPRSRSGCSPRR